MNKKAILILGSHRSGTSAVTAGLQGFDVYLGKSFRYKSEENQKGFFEHLEINRFNDELLAFLNGAWDNPVFDTLTMGNQKEAAALDQWYERAEILLTQCYPKKHPYIVIKDPRICQLLPFWNEVLLRQGFLASDIYYIHVLRHPVEVVKSQLKRSLKNADFYNFSSNPLPPSLLWLSMTFQSLRDVVSDNNLFIAYQELLENPEFQLQRIAGFIGLEIEPAQLEEYSQNFLDINLKHNLASDIDDHLISEEIIGFYQSLLPLTSLRDVSKTSIDKLLSENYKSPPRDLQIQVVSDLLSQSLNTRRRLVDNFEAEKQQHEAEKQKYEAEKQKYEAEKQKHLEQITNKNQELQSLVNSRSWRITAPLRMLSVLLKGGVYRLSIAGLHFFRVLAGFRRILKTRMPWFSKSFIDPVVPLMKKLKKGCQLFASQQDLHHVAIWRGVIVTPLNRISKTHKIGPKVSIIVPNYNHAPYLRQRLESIYNQSYTHFEVILLDDCSSDDSREILGEFQKKHAEKTIFHPNRENSGGVFFQWKKGLKLASGDLIWIAESDDWCDHDFLEQLVPAFEDESLMLSYCRSSFIDTATAEETWTIENYLSDIDPKLWDRPFSATAHQIVNTAWAIKNIIPNVSSAVFRNPGEIELFNDQTWQNMRICGDWVFYLHIIRGGTMSYTNQTTNYYRQHSNNTSVNTHQKDIYYQEQEMVAKYLNQLYKFPFEMILKQENVLRDHWKQTRAAFSQEEFEKLFSTDRIYTAAKERKPNLLMAGYAFSAGGGETFPIQLANLFRQYGYAVTFLDFAQEPREPGIRSMLRKDIPVVNEFVKLHQIITDLHIEIIHSHHAWVDNTIIDILPEENKTPHVISLHGMYEMESQQNQELLLPRLIQRAGKLVYTADKNLEPFNRLKLPTDKLVKIGNALASVKTSPADLSSLGITKNSFVLCLVSRAIETKGWKEAIESVSQARELSKKDIHLLMIGEGPEYETYKNSNLPYVHFLGFRNNIRDYFSASDMGFLPTRFQGESYPLVLIDCLNTGKPVLASSIGEIPHMLDANGEVAGQMFDLQNWEIPINTVAELIAEYSENEVLYNAAVKASAIAVKKFSPEKLRTNYDKIYKEMLSD